ncbi:MAG: sigma-70 family RNA polymerase sigma factor [Bryobacteraceae bacterium]
MRVVSNIVQPAKELALSLTDTPTEGRGRAWFDAIFREHYPRVVAMLARLTGDRGCAEEIAADTFCKLSARAAGQDEGLIPWVYRVATNAGLDALRMNARRRQREQAAHAESLRLAPSSCALEAMMREERRARVQEILGDMKPRDAQILLLRAEGLAYRELAETVGVQASSIGTLLARAEAEFERKFRARYGETL